MQASSSLSNIILPYLMRRDHCSTTCRRYEPACYGRYVGGGTASIWARRISCDYMAHDKYEAYDDVSNEPLVPSLVQAARKEELEYFKTMKVYEYAPLAECLKVTSKQPIRFRVDRHQQG